MDYALYRPVLALDSDWFPADRRLFLAPHQAEIKAKAAERHGLTETGN